MELQVYAIIAIVFLASFFSLLFINKQLRGGKTFEEVLAEKRHLAEKLYGPSKKKGTKKVNSGKKVGSTSFLDLLLTWAVVMIVPMDVLVD